MPENLRPAHESSLNRALIRIQLDAAGGKGRAFDFTRPIVTGKTSGSELQAGGHVQQAADRGIRGRVHVVVVVARGLGNPGIGRHPVEDVVDAHGELHAAEQAAGPTCVLHLLEGVGFLEIP